MFIGFAISPEWNPLILLDPTGIQIDVICSQHFQQSDSHRRALSRILDIVRQELGVPHVRGYPSCVSQVISHPSSSPTSSEAQGTATNGIMMARHLPLTMLTVSPVFSRNIHVLQSTGLRGDSAAITTHLNHDCNRACPTVGELQHYFFILQLLLTFKRYGSCAMHAYYCEHTRAIHTHYHDSTRTIHARYLMLTACTPYDTDAR